LDRELARFCRKLHCRYTRYADDITISTLATGFDSDIVISLPKAEKKGPVIGVGLAAVIEKHDLKINPTKTRVRTYMERQEVTGLVVNTQLNVRRKFVRNLRAIIDNANRYGILAANTRFQARFDTKTRRGSSPPLIDHLNGKLDYLRMVRGADDPLYTRYAISANKLSLNRPYGVTVWGRAAKLERLLAEAVWMLLGSNSQGVQVTQGTAFSLARVGVITAAHVLNDSSVTSWAIVKASDPTIKIPITEGRIHHHLDIAILTCVRNQSASLRIRPETVTQGEAATIVGFPDWNSPGDRLFIGNSHLVQLEIASGVSYLLTGTTLRSGISGGPILDEAGLVMGVALAGESNPIAPNGGVAAKHIDAVKNLPIVPLPTRKNRTYYRSNHRALNPGKTAFAKLSNLGLLNRPRIPARRISTLVTQTCRANSLQQDHALTGASERVFDEVGSRGRPLLHCKVFIDLEEASLDMRAADVHAIVTQLELHSKSNLGKMAVVSSEFELCGRLQLLRDLLCSWGFRVAVFDNTTGRGAVERGDVAPYRASGDFLKMSQR
jgi:hypothetical protein